MKGVDQVVDNILGASPWSNVVKLGCAEGEINSLWQEGKNVGVIQLQSKNKRSLHYTFVTRDYS